MKEPCGKRWILLEQLAPVGAHRDLDLLSGGGICGDALDDDLVEQVGARLSLGEGQRNAGRALSGAREGDRGAEGGDEQCRANVGPANQDRGIVAKCGRSCVANIRPSQRARARC